MLITLALSVGLAAPAVSTAECLRWARSDKVTEARSRACMQHLLAFGYGGTLDAEALTLDPGYGAPWEPDLLLADLERAVGHITRACKDAGEGPENVCHRSLELFNGMISRRMSLQEDVDRGSFEPVLAKLLAGEALAPADLTPVPDMPEIQWSALTLWKLRNAPYARHGYRFKKADLNTFFYGPRSHPEDSPHAKLLPLPEGQHKDVKLSPIDGQNVRLIKAAEDALQATAGKGKAAQGKAAQGKAAQGKAGP